MLSIGFLYAIDNWHSTTFQYTTLCLKTHKNGSFFKNMNFGAETSKIAFVDPNVDFWQRNSKC